MVGNLDNEMVKQVRNVMHAGEFQCSWARLECVRSVGGNVCSAMGKVQKTEKN